ncbi:MAG: XdhC family protein [Rhodospirillales bacterium]
MERSILNALLNAQKEKRAVALLTDFTTEETILVDASGVVGGAALDDATLSTVRERLHQDRSGMVETPDGRSWFVRAYNPPLRLMIIGAVHTAQVLAPMARMAGYDVTLIDPRSAFANAERFPGVTLLEEWPDEALRKLDLDHRSAVVTLSHDPKFDEPALTVSVRSPAFYIGALGSRRTHARRVERLQEAGLSDAEIGRIHGPVGLPIGSLSPAEIAISILAEMTRELRRPAAS